jgi:ppGpp synthetase/RelA/SpoT-type nucleotidyltranferase
MNKEDQRSGGGSYQMKEQKIIFTKEELAARVRVPAIVEQDLKRIITDRLEQCGLYFRVFSRIKTATSIARKFEMKDYGEHRKIQDLVGLRINVYFDDDVDICRHIMENTFETLEWSATEQSEDEFKPTKLNGVFRLPEYLKAEISEDTWAMYIDDTFEIQIKTMFFEGWHEIEHDMRYKGEELWKDYSSFSRYLNSILATLELCDKSMITLFEDLGHALYKSGSWSGMIKSHFRLKLGDVSLYPEVEQLLTEDQANPNENLGKRIYKTPKTDLVEMILKRNRKIPVNVNTIVALLNDNEFHDERLRRIFKEKDVYNDGKEESDAESRHYELRPLRRHPVFQMRTLVDGSRLKCDEMIGPEQIFERSAEYIYRWVVQKYAGLFSDMPKEVSDYRGDMMAYHVTIQYDREQLGMHMHVRHMDMEVGGRIWYSEASLEQNEQKQIILKLCNGYAEPERENRMTPESGGVFFSYPGYYKDIVGNVGIYNGMECLNKRRILKEEQILSVRDALEDPERLFPIVLIVSCENGEGMMDEEWLGQFRVSDFTRAVWRYAHVLTCYEKTGRMLLTEAGIEEIAVPQIYIFWPDGKRDSYGPEDIRTCSFGRHLENRDDDRTYDIVRGGQAFYHKLVTELRDWNMSAQIWDGMKM